MSLGPVLADRRAFLTAATAAALLLLLPGSTGDVGLDASRRRRLSRVARLLYPHEALPDVTYEAVLASLRRRADEDPSLAATLRDGLRQLDRAAKGVWSNAPPRLQLQALRTLEASPFFDTVRQAVVTELYERPEVWRLIGYEGPSAPLGGYLPRGFDDIAWLPREGA
jgi:hypothetical protein